MFNAFSEYKSKVEGRANVVMLREAETEPVRKGSGRTPAPELQEKEEPDTRLVGQEPYDGVLYYVQIGFLGSRKPLNDKVFKSYRNRVTEKREPGRGYRYLVGGVRDYDAIVKIQSEARKEFPDAFVVAYEGDKRIDVKTARRKTGQ